MDLMEEPSRTEAARALAALPPELAAGTAPVLSRPGHLLVCLWEGEQLAGCILGLARPTGAVLRLALAWVPPAARDAVAVGHALATKLEAAARARGLLCWRGGPDSVIDAGLRSPLGIAQGDEHWLGNERAEPARPVPYHRQTTRFTCGPASLLMALGALQPGRVPGRQEEIALWREATTIVSLSGPGGCDPLGLALAAEARGFAARVFLSTREPVLMERADTEEKRDLIRFVQAEFRKRVAAANLPVEERPFTMEDIRSALADGALVLVLVSQTLTQGRDTPHWILLHGQAGDWFLTSDPWIDPDRGEVAEDAHHVPIRAAMLERMAWYGSPPYRAAVVVGMPAEDGPAGPEISRFRPA
jgi:hypothetical protein